METSLQYRGLFYAKVLKHILRQSKVGGGQIVLSGRGARHLSLGFKMENALSLNSAMRVTDSLALKAEVSNVQVVRDRGFLIYQFELPRQYHRSYTREDLERLKLAPNTVGIDEKLLGVEFSFDDQPHALFAGTSGSGKTEGIKSTLVGLTKTFTPDELGMLIIDPKGDMPVFSNLAHLLSPIAFEPNDISKILIWLDNERISRTRQEKATKKILCVIDEVDDLSVLGNKQNLRIIQDLTKKGRGLGIHVVVGTQKPTHTDLPKILDNLMNRYIGQVSDATISSNISGHSGLMAHKLTGKGDFFHILGPVTRRFQVAQATTKDYDSLPRGSEAEIGEVEPFEYTEPEDNKGGRPTLEINAKDLAKVILNPRISVRQAKEQGLSYDRLTLHKVFITDLIKAICEEFRRFPL